MRKIAYNSQRNNDDFGGQFRAYNQCFSTCAIMFMSHYSKQIAGDDDRFLKKYLFDAEATLNPQGLGARLRLKYKWIKGATSVWWLVQQEAINDYLHHYGVKGQAVFYDATMLIESLPEFAKLGPIILGTSKIGGLPGGHIILIVDYNAKTKSLVCHDPFGDARNQYGNTNGAYVEYDLEWITPYIQVSKDCCRCMRWVI